MAVSPEAGNQVVVLHDAVSLSTYLNDYSLTASVNTEDVTVFGDDDVRRHPTLKDLSASLSGIGIGSTDDADDIFNDELAASTDPVVTIGPAGDSTGDRADLFAGIETNFEYSAPVAGVVSVSADYENAKEIGFGRWLRPLSANDGTTNDVSGSSVQSASTAGTTGGLIAHLHATTVSTGFDVLVAIQHTSSTAAGYTNIFNFTLTTASSQHSQRNTATGTIKEHVRYTLAPQTTSTSAGATLAVAFARLGDSVKD